MADLRGKNISPRRSSELASLGVGGCAVAMPDECEIWKPVGGLGKFEARNFGRVRFKNSGKLKSHTLARSGYVVVNLFASGIWNVRNVHSLVTEAFPGPRPAGWMVVHLDTNRVNNHWGNQAYRPLGERRPANSLVRSKTSYWLDLQQAIEIYRRANRGATTIDLAEKFGISAPMVSNIKFGRKWRTAGHAAGYEDV